MISFGFWPGDDTLGDAADYAYPAPEPQALREQRLPVGEWIESGGGSLAVRYDAVRAAPRPRTTLLAFCQAAYDPGAGLLGWKPPASTQSGARPQPSSIS